MEILHHLVLVCIKPCKSWDKLPINWCRISSINSISHLCSGSHQLVNFDHQKTTGDEVDCEGSRYTLRQLHEDRILDVEFRPYLIEQFMPKKSWMFYMIMNRFHIYSIDAIYDCV